LNKQERRLNHRRSLGVARAWRREKGLVCQGRGTREWAMREQKTLLDEGRIRGYQGHHMKSVAKYPQYADDPNNIQFLRSVPQDNEHLRAHGGDYRNETESMYDVKSGMLLPLPPGSPRPTGSKELREKAVLKRGYTRFAEWNTQKEAAPRRRKAQTQVEFEGRTYKRAMIQAGGTQSKAAVKKDAAPAKKSTQSAAKKSTAPVHSGAKKSVSKAPAKKSGQRTSGQSAAQRSTISIQPAPSSIRSTGTVRGSVRQMARQLQERARAQKK